MMLLLSFLDAHPMSSVAHSFQDRTDLAIGSSSISGELPTEISLLANLSEYGGYRMIESLHVERAHGLLVFI